MKPTLIILLLLLSNICFGQITPRIHAGFQFETSYSDFALSGAGELFFGDHISLILPISYSREVRDYPGQTKETYKTIYLFPSINYYFTEINKGFHLGTSTGKIREKYKYIYDLDGEISKGGHTSTYGQYYGILSGYQFKLGSSVSLDLTTGLYTDFEVFRCDDYFDDCATNSAIDLVPVSVKLVKSF